MSSEDLICCHFITVLLVLKNLLDFYSCQFRAKQFGHSWLYGLDSRMEVELGRGSRSIRLVVNGELWGKDTEKKWKEDKGRKAFCFLFHPFEQLAHGERSIEPHHHWILLAAVVFLDNAGRQCRPSSLILAEHTGRSTNVSRSKPTPWLITTSFILPCCC